MNEAKAMVDNGNKKTCPPTMMAITRLDELRHSPAARDTKSSS
jgi:hypothetical protein